MYDAFISYSHANLELVLPLKRELESRGLRAFMDIDAMRPGHDWPPQIGQALHESRMMILCWSEKAAQADWVKAEINHCLSGKPPVPVLPWLLDNTQLPTLLQHLQGVKGTDPAPVVQYVLSARSRYQRRRALQTTAGAAIVVLGLWFSSRLWVQESKPHELTFHGHIFDEQGDPIPGAMVEAEGKTSLTKSDGRFDLVLPGSQRRGLRLSVQKAGFKARMIQTQSDVPDQGVRLEKDR